MKKFLVLLIFAVLALDVFGVDASEINWLWATPPTFPNEAYGPLTDVNPDLRGDNQLFDVWCPDGDGPFPVYIYAHGGSFTGGSKALYNHPGKYLPDDDVVFMNINYRLGLGPGPAIDDGLAMVAYVKANAAKYKIDPEKIVLGGNSAGGIMMSEIIYTHQEPGIIGMWSLNPWYQNDYSPARLAAYPIPIVQVAYDLYPTDNNHSALLGFTHVSDNWSLGVPSMFMGGGNDVYTFGYEETYDYNPQLWRDGAWIKNTEGVNTGEALPTLGEWIHEITPKLGYDCFFMGHSFFAGQQVRLPSRAAAAGLTEHVQQWYGSAGATGQPLNLWNDPAKSAAIKAMLDGGGIELFGMVVDEGVEGYMNWIDYALQSNPLKQVMIGMSWLDYPAQKTLAEAEAQFDSWLAVLHGQIDTLRTTYPDLEFYAIPYGEAVTELRALYEADNLPQITAFTGLAESSLHIDDKGHAGNMVLDATTLVWLSAIYGVDLLTLNYDTGWHIDTQLKQIATDVMSRHDSAYNSTEYNSAQPVEFWASAMQVYAGESATLSWNVPDAEWIFIDRGTENIVSTNSAVGSVDVVPPPGINTYVLISSNSFGSATQELVVVAVEDFDPPTPNPPSFSVAPNATGETTMTMRVGVGTDASGPVEYRFIETSGNPGGTTSDWQTTRIHNDTGLTPETVYSYQVQMRDAVGNIGTASAVASATTDAPPGEDLDPPTPNPAEFSTAPNATSDTAITMTATAGSDVSGPVEYRFIETSGNPGADTSDWQTTRTYTDSGLTSEMVYSYQVQMRDAVTNLGTASASIDAAAIAPEVNGAGFISNNVDYTEAAVAGIDLDLADDWWIHGADAATETFSKKINSGITLVAQGGGTVLAQNRTAHTYVWANGTATLDNPSAPAAHDPNGYRRRQYAADLLGGAPSLDLSKGAYYSVDVVAGNTNVNKVTIYGMGRRNDEIYVEATLRDSSGIVINATLSPQLLGTQLDGAPQSSFAFSLDFQAAASNDVLSFTLAGYNDAETVDRSLAIDAVTLQDMVSIPAPVPNTNIPNVIIIFTDDHGYTDLGIHGIDPHVKTPMLDSLAAGGALMRHGYATAPQCVPSRAGILSGRIQNTFGTRQNGNIWGANPLPLDVPTVAERIAALGIYKTGMVGKWHLNPPVDAEAGVDYPGTSGDYDPEDRGFQEYWRNSTSPYVANFDLAGNSIAEQSISDSRNRVIVQGEAAEAFIERNVDKPFFLYLSLYGPHVPTIATNDAYYLNFPELDYPNYPADMDDVRRKGLALIHAMDDAVAGVVATLRELGIEENTLILFSGDNGAQPKFWNSLPGIGTVDKWDGSENLPLRGEKGSLWEGGIKVPMFAYWKGTIASNQVIDEPVWTLDFTATALKLAGGTLPPEFDGVDILPFLSGETNVLARSKPMFWDWGEEIAIRKGEWKMVRDGSRKNLFNLARDPMELYDVKADYPDKFQQLEAELMAWYNALPAEGQSPLGGDGINFYVTGATSHPADSRYVLPFSDGSPIAYPAPLQYGIPAYNGDGDTQSDWEELMAGNDPVLGSDLFRIEQGQAGTNGSFVVEVDGLENRLYTLWHTDNLTSNLWNPVVTNGPLPADALISLGDSQSITQGFYRVEVSE